MDAPDDILAIAQNIADSIASPEMPSQYEMLMVADAIMAERERCAVLVQEFVTQQRIVDEIEHHVNSEHGGDTTIDHFVPVIARLFAAAIRRGAS